MLTDLHIRNLAVLEAASIEFGPGFNVLSGETGAGKSIVVDSLALLSGVRASTELIRTGAETLTVTGVFRPEGEAWRRPLEAAGLEPQGDELVIRREVSRAGRNRVFVDDQPVTLKLLADLAPSLLRIHGQREELGLVDPELQRTWLDRCGGAQAAAPLRSVAKTFDAYRTLALRLERLTGDERARQERIDFLRFQLSEIDGAGLEAGEEDALRQEREVLRHAEAIQQGLSQAAEVLFDREEAAHGALARALQALQGIVDWEPAAAAWAGEVEELEIRLGEMESALRRRIDEVEADPRRLDAVEDRLAVLERLLSKYGATSADVLALRDRLDGELAELEDAEGSHAELEAQITEALERYRVAAEKLTAARKRWAKRLTTRVHEHLRGLALGKARFEVDLEPRRRQGSPLVVGGNGVEPGPLGIDHVTYLFSPNPGEEAGPLAKVASGGELSRLYLAVQLASRGDDGAAAGATLVFDEVDTGIGGAEAAELGAKVRRLARGGQVFAVTHLPQVASQADTHFKVKKDVQGGRTRTAVDRLSADGRVEEIARMLAGSKITELSLSHARELITETDG